MMHALEISLDMPVGEIAAAAPLATKVFARHGIDFCCGGGVPLSTACEGGSASAQTVLDEIRAEIEPAVSATQTWNDAPLDQLIDHIVANYHRPLDEELPRISTMAAKVLAVHGDKDPRLAEINEAFVALKAELEPHMLKEEQVLFPMIRQGRGAMTHAPIHVMRHEHDEAGSLLARLRKLTDGYQVPDGACNTWTALWHALADLERSLHEHIHLENNILFPRALNS